MRVALIEGRKALPTCLPNPPVGCVFVKGDKIVAVGHTQAPGEPHAEATALRQWRGGLENISIFVTLEPCSFHGRTPSCARSLVERGAKQIYVAVLDPDPRNDGQGIEILKAAGVQVSVGLLAAEALQDLGPYLCNHKLNHERRRINPAV